MNIIRKLCTNIIKKKTLIKFNYTYTNKFIKKKCRCQRYRVANYFNAYLVQ